MLTVAYDSVDEHSELLVLSVTAAGGDDVGSLEFTLWDASVPMLPFVAQLLLAAFLALGTASRTRTAASPWERVAPEAAGAEAAGLAVGLLLMTVSATTPAAPSVSFEPQPGGVEVRAVVGF